MTFLDRARSFVDGLTGITQINRLTQELEELRSKERTSISYIRRKVNQLLRVMGTLPLKPEELDDQTLLELDPIGIIADSFVQVLEHLQSTNEQLSVAHDEIQAIFAATGVGILVVDNEMKIKAYNPRLREIFHLKNSSIMGDSCLNVVCGTGCPPENCTFERVMSLRREVHQYSWVNGDKMFDVSGAPLKNKYGEVTHVVLVYSDMTDRSRTEEALRESERMYRTLFNGANDMIQSVDMKGSFLYVNPAWKRILGYTDDEVATLSLPDVIHSSHLEACSVMFNKIITGEFSGRVSTIFVTKDGREVEVEGNVSCCFKSGEPVYTCGIFREVLKGGKDAAKANSFSCGSL